ncbi:MAG: hypothetical protein AB1646_19350 [Thermodesulfobacteriota bacterium]
MEVRSWYAVEFDAQEIRRRVSPPGREPWSDNLRWADIIRVCLKIEPAGVSDGIYLFTRQRSESYAIPMEAEGGTELWTEVIRLGLYPPDLAIQAFSSAEGFFEGPLLLRSLDRERWTALLGRLGAHGDVALFFDRLVSAYSGPHRAYHNQVHICECLSAFDSARDFALRPDEVELAIWCHDVVYDTRAAVNEERSARWCRSMLAELHITGPCADYVADLIMATTYRADPLTADASLLVDVDLHILGASPARFAEYDEQVRSEYDWVPEELYRSTRIQVLQSFLERTRIFNTDHFFTRYEAAARANLRKAIEKLTPP